MSNPIEFDLIHDRVLVTGGGSGIGRAVALALAQLGACVYIMGRRKNALGQTQEMAAGAPGRIVPVPCDLTSVEEVEAAFAAVERDGGQVQALVHSAASVYFKAPIREMTFDGFSDVIGTTLFTAFNAVHRWGTALLTANLSGAGVVVTSTNAPQGGPGVGHSSAGKAGVESFVKTAAREWGPAGVRINIIGPGIFPVEKTPPVGQDRVDAVALQRLGQIDEIVGPILFMLTTAASYCTGADLRVDGGLRLPRNVTALDDDRARVAAEYR